VLVAAYGTGADGADMAALNADPLRFLTFPDDDIMALLVAARRSRRAGFSTWWA